MSSARRLLALFLLALFLTPGASVPARADDPAMSAHVAELKRLQVRLMMRGAQRELNERLARARAKRAASRGKAARPDRDRIAGEGRRPADSLEPADPAGLAGLGSARTASPMSASAIATNQIVNNRAGDGAASGQCEVSIGASGNNLVAAWNDGQGFIAAASTQGFAYSSNNGTSWTDGGVPPIGNGVALWTSDPVIAVNEKTGSFYFAALCSTSASPASNGIGVVKGTFSGGVLTWGTPRVVVSGTDASAIFDKEWMAVDTLSGNLYVVYSRFTVSGGVITSNHIEFSRNTSDNLLAWTAPVQISAVGDDGRVQGARVAVGPAGTVWTVWNAIGSSVFDFMRTRRSTTQGASFAAEVTAASQITNFGSGAPGFNRGLGFAFPGIAVDHGTGANAGRCYLTWNESINFYGDTPPNPRNVFLTESEPNDTPTNANAFTLGQNLVGTISNSNDLDYWKFNGTQGQTVYCELDSVYTTALDVSFRLFCTDGTTRLAFSETGTGGFNNASGLIVFTLPSTGTYYLRAASFNGGVGGYRIMTTTHSPVTESARDHRDIFLCSSNNGTTWTTPVRVNQDVGRLDDWLPEVAVARNGNVYVQWYDWRDAPAAVCAGSSMIYLARSTDGGVTWPDASPVTTTLTAWTNVGTNIIPNQGDYSSLFANQNAVYSCWSDGRNGDPDVFMATVNQAFTPVEVSLVSAQAEPGLVRLVWFAPDGNLLATVYRRSDGGDWASLGEISPDGTGQLVFEDRSITPGKSYDYRLGLHEADGEVFTGQVTIDVPLALTFAIQEVYPNPSDRDLWVSFALPTGEAATIDLLDVTGRRVMTRAVSGPGTSRINLAEGRTLAPGVYIVRLSQSGRSVVARASVVR
jgi:hypothetical protein